MEFVPPQCGSLPGRQERVIVVTSEDRRYRSVWSELYATEFRQGWIDAGGLRTRFIEAGSPKSPSLIFLHGTAGSWENFALNIAAHAEHLHCFAFDMIGAGLTDKPDYDYETPHYVNHLHDFMDAVKVERASLIGLSLGARVAARFAIDHPQRVNKLILLSATAYFPAQEIQKSIGASRAAAAENPTWDNVRDILKDLVHDETSLVDDLIALRLAVYRRPEMKKAMGHILALLDPPVYNRNRIPDNDWRRLTCPTMIVASVDHADVFLETSRAISKLVPNAHVVEMTETSHWPQLERPELFNSKSLEFLLKT
jgi:2-hydroxy-6-oxonona-2,4-dienedioate hydrolase